MKKTAYSYILREILPVFFIGLMTFTVILLMDKILKLIELIVNRGVDFSQIIMLLVFISPSFLILTIPMAVLLSVLLSFGRLSGDSEVTAFKASGISLYQLYLPVSVFSLCACLLTAFLVVYGLPWGNRGFMATLSIIAQSKADVEIKERVFNDAFKGLVVYVDEVPTQGRQMKRIMIHDEREEGKTNTIFAEQGYLVSNPETHEVTLRLFNGDLHRSEPKAQVYQKIRFSIYDLKLDISRTLANLGRKLREQEMSVQDLRNKIKLWIQIGKDPTPLEVELHKRYAIPFACLVFGLIGVPLGIQPRRSGRSFGFVFSILIFLAYYVSMTAFELLAIRKSVPPYAAGWVPNILFAGLGVYLLIKAAKDIPFKPLARLMEGIEMLQRKWRAPLHDH
jgi:lipopolysaccharide export system permease protein